MKQNTKDKVKGLFFVLLIAVGVVKGFAEERNGTVIAKADASISRARVFVQDDVNGNIVLFFIPNKNSNVNSMMWDKLVKEGTKVVYDDTENFIGVGESYYSIPTKALISFDGKYIFDILNNWHVENFPYATVHAKRQREQGR
jgi:hypothetical protein